jgi:hypothetical protein
MKTIYKYELERVDSQTLMLPAAFEVLTVDAQHGKIFLWAIVDPEETELSPLSVMIKGTGQNITDDEWADFYYLKTVHFPPFLVYHVFLCVETI